MTAEQVFVRLASLPGCAFLDSRLQHPHLGRYSYVAADPIERWCCPAGDPSGVTGLQRQLAGWSAVRAVDLPPFQGGAMGVFGYELGRSYERLPHLPAEPRAWPAVDCGIYDVVVAFDHVQQRAWLLSQGWPETDLPARRQRAETRLQWFADVLRRPAPALPDTPVPPAATLPSALTQPTRWHGVVSNFSRSDYQDAVARAVEYIVAGDVFQVNLSQRLACPATTTAARLCLTLRNRAAAPFGGFYDSGEWQVVSASPERFVRVIDGMVETRPIKGTRRVTRQPEADLFAGSELLASDKDRSENIMIADLLRNDLSRVCTPSSVATSQLCGLESYGYVQHLVSVVEGRLAERCDWSDLLAASFPGGSITGAPKPRAMEIISELEGIWRGPYCGCLGFVGADGTMDLNILIRTIICHDGWWTFPVGGGVVAGSVPSLEYEETWHKAAGILAATQ